jgi:aldehyde:ferredoxin oxidoreductase
MTYMYGGAILFVNLDEGRISKAPTSSYSGAFLGGRGINIKLLYDGSTPGTDPLNSSSLLIFGVGPLCGTPVSASRTEVTARSPETGFLGSSNFGGHFGPELKSAGYDHVVITGKANKPVYLLIHNEQVEIRDASKIWGKDSYETQSLIRDEVDSEVQIACIGPAGENLVCFATIQHDLGHGAGRTGMGAVMGSKNLKAIVVRGTTAITLAHPEKYLSIAEQRHKQLSDNPCVQDVQKHGMAYMLEGFGKLRVGPDGFEEANQHDLAKKYQPKKAGCAGCLQQCMDLYPVEAKGGGGAISCTFYTQPFTQVGNNDLDLALECGLLAQRYGIDIISLMGIISWLMRLYESGIITVEDTDGIPMEWGTRQAIIGMLKKIVFREGFGDTLAAGILPAAKKIGRGSKDYAYQVKGLPLYSPTTPDALIPTKGRSLCIAVSPRGDAMRTMMEGREARRAEDIPQLVARQNEKFAAEYMKALQQTIKDVTGTEKAYLAEEYEGKPELVVYSEDEIIIFDCLSSCKLIGAPFLNTPSQVKYLATLFSAGMGAETTFDMLVKIAKRVRNLERVFNVREGMTRDGDSLPKGFMDHPLEKGDSKGSVLKSAEFEKMKDRYYALRGWDIATGIPTRETLEQTGLEDIARDLEKSGKLPVNHPTGK